MPSAFNKYIFLLIPFTLTILYCSSPFSERPVNGNSKNSTQKEGFDGSRKDINAAIDHMCEFTGTSHI